MKTYGTILTLAALLFAAGCAGQEQLSATEPICISGSTKTKAMWASEIALGKMHFTLDKSDAEQGLIRTNPLSGAQFFEFWRDDNVGAFNTAEANLNSIRRIAELSISQQENQVCISCNVTAQRLSLPENEITSTSQMRSVYSQNHSKKSSGSAQDRTAAWIDLGRDSRLETKILKRIEKQLGK